MARTEPFERHTAHYDDWFERNRFVYAAELRAVRSLMPEGKRGLEIGVGTGRFAAPLGVDLGIEPSASMGALARGRGIRLVAAVAEHLPFRDSSFGLVLMVTTVCFLDDIDRAFREAFRVMSDGGSLLVGFVDRNSTLGRVYLEHQHENVFYRDATFYSVEEVLASMVAAGFHSFEFSQTVFNDLSRITENEVVEPGYGRGSFVVARGEKGE